MMKDRKNTLQDNCLTFAKLMRGAQTKTRTADVGSHARKNFIRWSDIQGVFDCIAKFIPQVPSIFRQRPVSYLLP